MHPLDETFNVDAAKEVEEIFGMKVNLPTDPTMRTVVELALKQYKDLVEDAMLLEPESRLPMLELAKDYLDLAKDTMYRESDLSIKVKKNEIQEKRAMKTVLPAPETPSDEPKTLSYDDVLDQIKEAKEQA